MVNRHAPFDGRHSLIVAIEVNEERVCSGLRVINCAVRANIRTYGVTHRPLARLQVRTRSCLKDGAVVVDFSLDARVLVAFCLVVMKGQLVIT